MTRDGGTKRDEVNYDVGLLTGMTVLMLVFVVIFSVPGWQERVEASWDQRPLWVAIAVSVLPMVLMAVGLARSHRVLAVLFPIGLVPALVANVGHRVLEPDPAWVGLVRGLGVVYFLIVMITTLVIYSRRYVELERLVFTEASAIAFFATLAAAAGYAALEANADLPRLSYAWIPLVGIVAWGVAALLFRRRLK